MFGFKKDFHFFGLIQPMADGLKLFLKEDFTPAHVRKAFYWLAPALTVAPALITVCVVPFGSPITLFGHTEKLVIADLDVGPLFVFAISSLTVYGITLAGWSSNSKFPFIGGVRSTAQMISYEIALGLSIIPVLMYFGELNLGKIVQHQADNGWLFFRFGKAGTSACQTCGPRCSGFPRSSPSSSSPSRFSRKPTACPSTSRSVKPNSSAATTPSIPR